MPKGLRKHELIVEELAERPIQSVKKQKLPALLVTADEGLWPQIGADLNSGLQLKQVDSIDELTHSIPAGQAGIVLWDARHNPDPAAILSRLSLHSSRFAVVALDDALSAAAWSLPLQQRQIVAHVSLPIAADELRAALESAHEEVNSRLALLGDGSAPLPVEPVAPQKRWLVPAAACLVAAALAAFLLTRKGSDQVPPTVAPARVTVSEPANPAKVAASPAAKPAAEADEQVDALIEKAQQAMLDRHYIDPVAGSALSLYHDVLTIDPDNGEARQGLQRLSEILMARVQSALDDRKFDLALQFLETARSIDANDPRLAALDERIASLRAELGPAQILAALNAQNFDRASQLIDEAAHSKSLSAGKLAQLRDDVRKRRDEFDIARLLKLVDARLQQEHLIDPRNDSAVYYLEQAKLAGATGPTLLPQIQVVLKRLTQMARAGIEQGHFPDVERIIAELHGIGASAGTTASLQRALNAARSQLAAQKPDQPQSLELAQSRLAQGKLTEPENDSALYYVNQLRNADPKNAGLAALTTNLQAQILDQARTALDAGDMEKSEALAQFASGLGSSSDLEAFNDRVRQKRASSGDEQLPEQALTRVNKLDVQYPVRALQGGIEGWVELGYLVTPTGSVANVRVLNASPSKVFDASATKAVTRLRYQPVIQGGKAIAVGTQVRIVYRVPK